MFRRLTTSAVIVLILAVAITGYVSISELKKIQARELEQSMMSTAVLLRENLSGKEDEFPGLADKIVACIRDELDTPIRLTVISREGELLYESDADPDEMNNHRSRPEIAALIRGEEHGKAKRYSSTLGEEQYYFAITNDDASIFYRLAIPSKFKDAAAKGLSRNVLLVALISISIAILSAYFLSRRYNAALKVIGDRTEEMGRGDYSVRISGRSGFIFPDIRHLTNSFNEMASSLEKQHVEMEEKTARLQAILNAMLDPLILVDNDKRLLYANEEAGLVFDRDIDPEETPYPQVLLTHAQELDDVIDYCLSRSQELEAQIEFFTPEGSKVFRVQAAPIKGLRTVQGVVIVLHDLTPEEEMANMRRDFVANVTHELKTPLTSILGYVDTMQNTEVSPDHQKHFLKTMANEGARLEKLINDVLSLSDIEQGQEDPIAVTSFDLRELIDEVLVLLEDQASEKRVALVADEEDPLMVKAERHHVKQILINLVDNGIKYGNYAGKVFIGAERDPKTQEVHILVEDDGPGIPKEAIRRIFERFYRVDKGRSRELGGTGLGLSIVKHLVLLYDGDVKVESSPDEGSRFYITMKI